MSDNTDVFASGDTQLVSQNVLDYIGMSQLLPDADWIDREVVAHGPGTHKKLALFRGRAWDSSRQQHMFGGQISESVKLIGEFEAESEITGEVFTAGAAYLPPKWAKLAEDAIKALPRDASGDVVPGASVTMLLTLGCRSTGKPVPKYSWTVATHIDREASPEMQRLRQLSRSPALQHRLALEPGVIEADATA